MSFYFNFINKYSPKRCNIGDYIRALELLNIPKVMILIENFLNFFLNHVIPCHVQSHDCHFLTTPIKITTGIYFLF